MAVVTLALLLAAVNTVNSLSCHTCAGADSVPSQVATAMTAANISTTVPVRGNCKGTTGADICTDGKFCVKKTVTYSIGVKSLSVKWDTYVKGCATVREDTKEMPTNTCYDISTSDKGNIKQHNDKDIQKEPTAMQSRYRKPTEYPTVHGATADGPRNCAEGSMNQSVRHCYCQKDFCNTASNFICSTIYLALTMFYFK